MKSLGFQDYIKGFPKDFPASIVVFLVALPLCLGIALASGAPLFSGLITGIIGGIVVGMLSGSQTSVSGPAAGLAVIVLDALTELATFELFLTTVVIAGVIQLILGYIKAGVIGLYFPSSVIKGMLAGIGLILILKQLPHFFGVDLEAFGSMEFWDHDDRNTFSTLQYAFGHIHPGALIIGAVSLGVLILWEQPFIKKQTVLGAIPGALLAVLSGAFLHAFVWQKGTSFALHPEMLVSLPDLTSEAARKEAFSFPDFSGLTDFTVWKTGVVIAIIASLETLLSIEAVDKLDPHKRHTPNNREMKAQGVGNILAGLVGGLPMTAVIVRSSANINAGNATRMSAIYHGFLLVISILVIPHLLGYVPLASLAAILLLIGYKLSRPSLYREQYKIGMNQFLPFISTIVAILLTDLLIGIIIGMGVGIFFILRANYKTPYYYRHEEESAEELGRKPKIKITLSEHVTFINKASLLLTFDHLPENREVTIDGSKCEEIDTDALEIIHDFMINAVDRNIDVVLVDMPEDELAKFSESPI